MPISPDRSQDVWKDIGQDVEFVVFNLNRKDQHAEQQAIYEFCDRSQAIIRSLRIRRAHDDLKVAIGFSNAAWDWLFPDEPKPTQLQDFAGIQNDKFVMPSTGGDIFLHVRARHEAVVYECVRQLSLFLRPWANVLDETKGFRYFEGRAIIGFIDGTEVPLPEDSPQWALVGDEDSGHINGSYAFLQKWIHDMSYWNNLSTEVQERAIGRRKFSDLELADDEKYPNAHNVASKLEIDGVEHKIIRMNVPFSDPARGVTGTMFIGYAGHWSDTRSMLQQMVDKGDFLLTFSEITSGQLFFIPSRDFLEHIADKADDDADSGSDAAPASGGGAGAGAAGGSGAGAAVAGAAAGGGEVAGGGAVAASGTDQAVSPDAGQAAAEASKADDVGRVEAGHGAPLADWITGAGAARAVRDAAKTGEQASVTNVVVGEVATTGTQPGPRTPGEIYVPTSLATPAGAVPES